jgi:hypothetical protein
MNHPVVAADWQLRAAEHLHLKHFTFVIKPQPIKSGERWRWGGSYQHPSEIPTKGSRYNHLPWQAGDEIYLQEAFAVYANCFVRRDQHPEGQFHLNWEPADKMPSNIARFQFHIEQIRVLTLGEITGTMISGAGATSIGDFMRHLGLNSGGWMDAWVAMLFVTPNNLRVAPENTTEQFNADFYGV